MLNHSEVNKKNYQQTLRFIHTLLEDLKDFDNDSFSHPLSKSYFGLQLQTLAAKESFYHIEHSWLVSLDKFLYLIELIEISSAHVSQIDLETDERPTEEDFFDYWDQTNLAQGYNSILQEGLDPVQASLKLKPILEESLLSTLVLHLQERPYGHGPDHTALTYHILYENGDNKSSIFLGKYFTKYNLPNDLEDFPFLMIDSYNPNDNILNISINEKVLSIQGTPSHSLTVDGAKIFILDGVSGDFSINKWKDEIQKALNIIKKHSLKSFISFTSHTTCLISHDQDGVVSYSFQDYPGVSFLNTTQRDFIDLIDDLIHENGHHLLNKLLNVDELIYEDDEKIFYSPWRESKRPIRGLYHAYCTFSWALFLFADLYDAISKKADCESILIENEQKIMTRLLEESIMLKACEPQLERAYHLGKISDEGLRIYQSFKKQISSFEPQVKEAQQSSQKKYPEVFKQTKNLEKQIEKEL